MAQGMIHTLSDTTTTKRSVADIIDMIDPQDTPAVSYFGTDNGSKFGIINLPNHKYAWFYDHLRKRETAIDKAGGHSDSDTTLTVDDASLFKKGDVVEIPSTGEKVWVDEPNTASNTIKVVRGWGGTTKKAIADDAAVIYLFPARMEGADSDEAYYTTPNEEYNQSQIFHWEIKVSGSEQDATSRYGISDTFNYQLMKALGGLGGGRGQRGRAGDLMIDLENTFFKGERIARTSSAAGAMGGAKAFIKTNTLDLGGDPLSEDVLIDMIQECWYRGGKPRTVMMGAFNKRLVNSWYRDELVRERSDRTGGLLIHTLETDFGTVDFMLNRHCPPDEVYILEKDYVGWITLRNWTVEKLAKTGDYERSQVIGEFGFVLKNEQAHALIYNTATQLPQAGS